MSTIEKKIHSHLDSGNKTQARSVLLAQLDAERFREEMKVASNEKSILTIEGLFEQNFEVDTVSSEEGDWDSAYWTRMNVELSNNFSKEKLSHVIEVMKFLRAKGDKKFIPKKINKPISQPINTRTETIENKGYIAAGLGAVTGAVIGAGLAKGVVMAPALKGAVIGGVAGAGIGLAYIIHSKKQT